MSTAIGQAEFTEKLLESFSCNDLTLNSDALTRLWGYYQISQDWGHKLNVTANLDFEAYLRENILDPALALKKWRLHCTKPVFMADLGAGGGYVGLTAKILDPELDFCILLESIRKKVSFMRHCIRELGLTNTIAVQDRAEAWSLDPRCNWVVSRATWSWADYLKVAQRYLAAGIGIVSFEGAKAHATNLQRPPIVEEYEIKPYGIKRYLYCMTALQKTT